MLLIPAIDIKDGKCVRLRQGRMDEDKIYSEDPVAMARRWVQAGARRLHIVDLNGATKGRPVNAEIVHRICEACPEVPIQVGGGIRDEDTIQQYLDAGVSYVILGTKAVTAPFSLLGAAFSGIGGGGGDELSYIEFDNGRASLNEIGLTKISALAKALDNRPSISLELMGRVDPASDLEGLKRVGIERKAKAQKLRDLVRQGEAQRSVEDIQFEKDEYQKYLKAAYGEESFPKPRNLIGLAVDFPVAEMEKLMMQHAKATDDDMRQLASQRAQTVRDALLATKLVGADRLFIVAAKPLTSEEQAKLKGKPSRVDFTMK